MGGNGCGKNTWLRHVIQLKRPTPVVNLGKALIDFWRDWLRFQNRLRRSSERPWVVNETSVTKNSILNAQEAHETRVQRRWNQEASPEFVEGKKEIRSLFHGDIDSVCGVSGINLRE